MKLKKQSGQVLFGTAVALVVLAGFAGLAIDMGTMRYQKRLEQTAADSAAIAGAQNLDFGFGVTGPGQTAAGQNGFTDNNSGAGCVNQPVGCISVDVHTNPATGPHAGSALYVEAIVTSVQPTYFMTIFGINSKPITARAVATNVKGGTNANCLYTLGKPTAAIIGINVQGKAHLVAPNCGIADNGNLDTTGNAYTVQSKTIAIAGACVGNDCSSPNVTCTAFTNNVCPPLGGVPPTEDPLKGITPPPQPPASASCPDLACNFVSSAGQIATIQPGTYSSILIGSNSIITMAPGIYYINGPGGLGFNGKGTLATPGFAIPYSGADGVMIYFTGSATMNKVNGGGGPNVPDIQLNPLTATQSATYAGMLFYQDPNDTATPWFGGDDKTTFNGTLYFPTQTLTFYGDTNQTYNGTVITYSIAINGNPTVNFGTSPAGIPTPASLTVPVLVE
jgi:hypothetical protein